MKMPPMPTPNSLSPWSRVRALEQIRFPGRYSTPNGISRTDLKSKDASAIYPRTSSQLAFTMSPLTFRTIE